MDALGELERIWKASLTRGPFSNSDEEFEAAVSSSKSTPVQIAEFHQTPPPPFVTQFAEEMAGYYDRTPSAQSLWNAFVLRVLYVMRENAIEG